MEFQESPVDLHVIFFFFVYKSIFDPEQVGENHTSKFEKEVVESGYTEPSLCLQSNTSHID